MEQKIKKQEQLKVLNKMSDKDYYDFMQAISNIYLLQKIFETKIQKNLIF